MSKKIDSNKDDNKDDNKDNKLNITSEKKTWQATKIYFNTST